MKELNGPHILTVWRKEMLEAVRDRRTLIMMIVVPLLVMPLFVLGPAYLQRQQQEGKQAELQPIAVVNASAAPDLVSAMATAGLVVKSVADPEGALQEGKIRALLVIPERLAERIESGEKTAIVIRFDAANTDSRIAQQKLATALQRYREAIATARLERLGLDREVLEPFSVTSENVASREKLGGFFLSFILPLFLVLWAAVGGSSTAIDVSAGEKERGTLESLLMAPVSRESLVIGKFLTILTVTLLAMLMSVLGFILAMQYGLKLFGAGQIRGQAFAGLVIAFKPLSAGLMLATAATLTAMMSGVTFSLFLWTRSFREAQTYASWLSFVVMIPSLLVQFSDFAPSLWSMLIPVYNATLVFKQLILGEFHWDQLVITLASSSIYALVSLWLSVRMFRQERVIFRQ